MLLTPMNWKPSSLVSAVWGSQRTATPEARDSARADSSRATSRAPSFSSWVLAGSRSDRLMRLVVRAISVTTTISSIRVKPLAGDLLPGAGLGVLALTADHTVGANAVDIDLAFHAGVGVLVGAAPGVVLELGQVGPPVGRDGACGGLGDERLQALLGGGIALV